MSESKSTTATGYPRDASWWSRPNTRTPKKLHRESTWAEGMAACNNTKIMLCTDMPHTVPADSTLLCLRCFPVHRGADAAGRLTR